MVSSNYCLATKMKRFFLVYSPPPPSLPPLPPTMYLQPVVLALVPLQQNIKIAISLFFMFLNIPHVFFRIRGCKNKM
jgi:hypothetical protein